MIDRGRLTSDLRLWRRCVYTETGWNLNIEIVQKCDPFPSYVWHTSIINSCRWFYANFIANAAAQRNRLGYLFEERKSSYQESYRLELIFATLAAFETLKAIEYISLAISGRVSLFHKYVVVDHPSTFTSDREIWCACVWHVAPTIVNASDESGKVEEWIFCEFQLF